MKLNDESVSTGHSLNKPFELDELKRAVEALKHGKGPGPDGIKNEMLKVICGIIPDIVLQLYNSVLATRHYPSLWKQCLILPIYKKGPKDIPSNYRAISLQNTFSKLFASMIKSVCIRF